MKARIATAAIGGLLALGWGQAAPAQTLPGLDLSADMRLRLEQDWDSRTASGAMREDRLRARIRLRATARLDLGSGITAQAGVRSGTPGSQQSANVTFHDFDGNVRGDAEIALDRYSIGWKGKTASVQAGRMEFPFFTQNEYLWDADIAPLGLAAKAETPLASSVKASLNAGAFRLPVGIGHFSGGLAAAQAVVEAGSSAGQSTLAAGLFRFEADRDDAHRLLLLEGNGSRDYLVLAVNAQHKVAVGGKPLVLGADFYRNLESYGGSADPLARAWRHQRTGFVLSSAWGDTGAAGHWQIGYRYVRIERLAVNGSYAQDDIARFGTPTQASLTGLTGHDLYANFALTRNLVLGVRAMAAERIDSVEDGKRARIDLSYKF